jgi:type I restriction enzyme M protein
MIARPSRLRLIPQDSKTKAPGGKRSSPSSFAKEVQPHWPDAWIDFSKTRVGYEIPINRHFYVYQPPRALADIEQDIKMLEGEIIDMLKEVA